MSGAHGGLKHNALTYLDKKSFFIFWWPNEIFQDQMKLFMQVNPGYKFAEVGAAQRLRTEILTKSIIKDSTMLQTINNILLKDI